MNQDVKMLLSAVLLEKKHKRENLRLKRRLKVSNRINKAMENEFKRKVTVQRNSKAESVPHNIQHMSKLIMTSATHKSSPIISLLHILKMFPNDPPQFDKELLRTKDMIGSGAYGKVLMWM